MPELFEVGELSEKLKRLTDAHLFDRMSTCGCSKQTLRLCSDCGSVTCRCERLGLNDEVEGRCPCTTFSAKKHG